MSLILGSVVGVTKPFLLMLASETVLGDQAGPEAMHFYESGGLEALHFSESSGPVKGKDEVSPSTEDESTGVESPGEGTPVGEMQEPAPPEGPAGLDPPRRLVDSLQWKFVTRTKFCDDFYEDCTGPRNIKQVSERR